MSHRPPSAIGVAARAGRAAALVLLVAVLVTGGPHPAAATAGGHYRPPVDAPITDPFDAPLNPYGPGNRGIQYATVPGTVILAAGDGVVVFAGSIDFAFYVTILHPDGVRTSYSYLAALLVGEGQSVSLGQPIGIAGPVFQIGARRGDAYFDPATLWGDGLPHVFLVPLDGHVPRDSGDAGEARSGHRPAPSGSIGAASRAAVSIPTGSDPAGSGEFARERGSPRPF